MPLLEGIKVKLGTVDFTVPPLTIKALRLLGPKFTALQKAAGAGDIAALTSPEHLDTILEVAHASIVRNHPDVTKDELEGLIDLTNLKPLFLAICGQSAMQQAEPGEAAAPKRSR